MTTAQIMNPMPMHAEIAPSRRSDHLRDWLVRWPMAWQMLRMQDLSQMYAVVALHGQNTNTFFSVIVRQESH